MTRIALMTALLAMAPAWAQDELPDFGGNSPDASTAGSRKVITAEDREAALRAAEAARQAAEAARKAEEARVKAENEARKKADDEAAAKAKAEAAARADADQKLKAQYEWEGKRAQAELAVRAQLKKLAQDKREAGKALQQLKQESKKQGAKFSRQADLAQQSEALKKLNEDEAAAKTQEKQLSEAGRKFKQAEKKRDAELARLKKKGVMNALVPLVLDLPNLPPVLAPAPAGPAARKPVTPTAK